MAKVQSFADKSKKKAHVEICPVCSEAKQFIKYVKAVKTESGSWKFRSVNIGVCKCNNAEVYS
jgi:hypothetical protein